MKERQSLSDQVIQEIAICIGKMQHIRESADRSDSARDLARSVRKTLSNCDKKLKAIEEMASRQERRTSK